MHVFDSEKPGTDMCRVRYIEIGQDNPFSTIRQGNDVGGCNVTTVNALLERKGSDVWSVAPDATVYDAIHLMAEKEIGALIVLDGRQLVGVISERDYARQIILKGRSSRETRVRDIMTSKVITGSPGDRVQDMLSLMSGSKIRHLPIVEGGKVTGVLSMGDLVKSIINEQQMTIEDLERYIHG